MVNFLDDTLLDIENYSCANSTLFPIFQAIKFVIVIIQIAVPFALIIWGSLDWFKALIAHDEKEMRIKRKPFIARVVAAFIILLLPVLIQLIAKAFAGAKNTSNFWKCYSEAQPKIDFKAWQKSYKNSSYSKPEAGNSGGSSTSGKPEAGNSGSGSTSGKPEAGNSGSGSTSGKPEAGNSGSGSTSGKPEAGNSGSGSTSKTKHCYEYTASTCPPKDDYGIACKTFLKRCATLEEYENAMIINGSEGR